VSSGTSRLKHPNYRPDIDGLRAIAVLAVVMNHAFPGRLPGGFIGVDVFFVISGFLISTIIFENLDSGTFTFREFYSRRIRRIFPALIITLVGVLVLGWLLFVSEELTLLGKHVAAGAGFLSNFVLQGEAGYFDSSSETKPLLHLWSLGIEEQFYIAWPLILWFAWKRQMNLLTITLLLAFASFYLNVQGVKTDSIGTFYLPHTRFWEMMTGSALAWITIYVKEPRLGLRLAIDRWLNRIIFHNSREPDERTLKSFIAIAGTSLLTFGFLTFDKSTTYPGIFALVPVLGSLLLIYAGPWAWINQKLLSNKILVWFGLISFPLYLWHWPLISFAWILEGGVPPTIVRVSAVLFAISLAWITKVFIEKPFRFSKVGVRLKVWSLCISLIVVGLTGIALNSTSISQSRGFENVLIDRKGMEFAYGSSLNWYRGKENWLFLGNNYDQSVAKLKLDQRPAQQELEATHATFTKAAEAAEKYDADLVLIVGPNKESVYTEFLPDGLKPSPGRYSGYFLNHLRDVPNLTVHNPTKQLLELKRSAGYLYWKTDTHWNDKGAFFAFQGFLQKFSIPSPGVYFAQGKNHVGDLIGISGLGTFPLDSNDDWHVIWKKEQVLKNVTLEDKEQTSFGVIEYVNNEQFISNKRIWVIGDSFSSQMRQFFNATFRHVHYVGHWRERLGTLQEDLANASLRPDMVVVIRVERSF
jgi:peptidoglycan/LPS O-acetylase OafA/YrhL